MSILELEKEETPENIIKIKNLITIGELDKALQLIKINKESLEYNDLEKVLYQLLECDILYQQGLYEKLYGFAEQIYKERLKLGDNLIVVDLLNLMADCLFFIDKVDIAFDVIKESERILKILSQNFSKGILSGEAYLAYVKGRRYIAKKDPDKARKYYEQSLVLGENLKNKLIIILSLIRIAGTYSYKGDFEQALIYGEKGLILAKKSKHEFAIAYSYNFMGNLHSVKGQIDKSIYYFNQSLAIFKRLHSVYFIGVVNNNVADVYRTKGNLKLALECLEKSLVINHDLGLIWSYANNHDYLIQILVDIGDFQKAKQYLHRFKVLNNQIKDNNHTNAYLFDKALILKSYANRAKQLQAREIFKQLIKKGNLQFEFLIKSLLSLCEISLDELHDTNHVELLNEIPLYINQIESIAKKQKSHFLLVETYYLKANFDSFTLNLDSAKSNLNKAQNVSERYGIKSLVQRLLIQREKIFKLTIELQKLKDMNEVIMDFTNFTPLKEQIRYMFKKRSILKDLNIER